jgi:hypothetical protein
VPERLSSDAITDTNWPIFMNAALNSVSRRCTFRLAVSVITTQRTCYLAGLSMPNSEIVLIGENRR